MAPAEGPGPRRRQAEVLAAIAIGGALGACARYGATLLWPTDPGAFPWTTFWITVTGSAAMGVLMVMITERATAHPLVRPFLGTSILGGYTTFSTYAVDAQHQPSGWPRPARKGWPLPVRSSASPLDWLQPSSAQLSPPPHSGESTAHRRARPILPGAVVSS